MSWRHGGAAIVASFGSEFAPPVRGPRLPPAQLTGRDAFAMTASRGTFKCPTATLGPAAAEELRRRGTTEAAKSRLRPGPRGPWGRPPEPGPGRTDGFIMVIVMCLRGPGS